MILNEKMLVKAMSAAASRGVLRLRFRKSEDTTTILTDEWLVTLKNEALPRKVIGLIAEYLGKVPASGCYNVLTHKKDYVIQYYSDDVFNADIRNLIKGEPTPAIFTGMHIFNWYIFAAEDGQLLGVRPESIDLLEHANDPHIIPEKSLAYTDNESAIYIKVFDGSILTPARQAIWGALTAIDWWESKGAEIEKPSAVDTEQMELAGTDDGEE